MQLKPFLKCKNRELGKNPFLQFFFDLRTVLLKNGTFKAYHPLTYVPYVSRLVRFERTVVVSVLSWYRTFVIMVLTGSANS